MRFYLSFTAPSCAVPKSIHLLFLSISTTFAWLTAIPADSLFFLSRPVILSLLISSSCLIAFRLFFTRCGACTRWDLWRRVDGWRRSCGCRLICCRLLGFCSFSIFMRGSLLLPLSTALCLCGAISQGFFELWIYRAWGEAEGCFCSTHRCWPKIYRISVVWAQVRILWKSRQCLCRALLHQNWGKQQCISWQ